MQQGKSSPTVQTPGEENLTGDDDRNFRPSDFDLCEAIREIDERDMPCSEICFRKREGGHEDRSVDAADTSRFTIDYSSSEEHEAGITIVCCRFLDQRSLS